MSPTRSFQVPFRLLSNALDRSLCGRCDRLSHALDNGWPGLRHRVFESGAPPGPTRQIATRGPVHPALCILGGPKMTTQ